jgi:hypothetical protein
VSLGASGAVFGLFTISVLVKVINSIFFISKFLTILLNNKAEPASQCISFETFPLYHGRCHGTGERSLRCLSWGNLLLTRYLHDTVLLLSLTIFEVEEWIFIAELY